MMNFLTANNLMDMAGLDAKFASMMDVQMDIRDKSKPIERRLPVLKEHLEKYDIYLKFKDKKALSEADKILLKEAHSYLKKAMNGDTSLPVNAWKEEYSKLTTEQKTLNQRYLTLKNEVKEAEQIRRSVYSILRQEQREQQPRRAHETEL